MTNPELEVAGNEDRGSDDEASDSQLLWRFRGGCQEAAREIYLRYAHRVRALVRIKCASGLANHVDAEDIVQSVFASFFRSAGRGRYEIRDGESLWKLLLVISLNKVRAEGVFHLAAKRDSRLTFALHRLPPSTRLKGETQGTAGGFFRILVEEALECLPPQHRCVVEKRIEGHEVAEIARQLS